MQEIIIEVTKYLMILLFALYAYKCFSIFAGRDYEAKQSILTTQTILCFSIHFLGYAALFAALEEERITLLVLYAAELLILILTEALYSLFYPKSSRLIVNNMCMLLCIGFIFQARLDTATCIKQVVLAALAITISLFVPVMVRKIKVLQRWTYLYAAAGILLLGLVLLTGAITGGAKLSFTVGPLTLQPSEFVKLLFVFFVAAAFREKTHFKRVVLITAIAAVHVLILVLSTDLGAAVIYFVVYLIMLFVATRQSLYLAAGTAAAAAAGVISYKLFSHVRVRVSVWRDPFANWDNGMQVGQSLFAIGTGSWLGLGLTQGLPNTIPVVKSDFVFAAVAEELGGFFALCLILVCLSCYMMFLNIALQLRESFYKLIALGLGTCYIFQVFLNVGGVIKFIPMTGLTLPWVSYGGSSLIATSLMFAIIQGLYILREDEEAEMVRNALRGERKRRRERLRG